MLRPYLFFLLISITLSKNTLLNGIGYFHNYYMGEKETFAFFFIDVRIIFEALTVVFIREVIIGVSIVRQSLTICSNFPNSPYTHLPK